MEDIMDHLKKKNIDNPLWHYINIGIYDHELVFTVDANDTFREKTFPVDGSLKSFTLGGMGNTKFSELHIVNSKKLNSVELRNRFRSLYRNLPDLHKNTITAPFVTTRPLIDGKISEREWTDAASLVGFTNLGNGCLCTEKTKAYISYDERYFYMAVRTPYQGNLKAKKWNAYDMPLWAEESYEIFLHPPFTGFPDFCQLIGNIYGDQSDLKMLNLSWNGKWDWKTSVSDTEW